MDLTVGERIFAARKRARINQADLAYLVGISTCAFQNCESGRVSPRLKLLEAIARQLNVRLSYLVGIKEEEEDGEEGRGVEGQ